MGAERSEHEDPLATLAAHLPAVVYTYRLHADGGRELLFLSGGLEELLGRESAKAVGASIERLRARIHPDDVPIHARAEEVAQRDRKVFDTVVRLQADDGYRWMHIVARIVELPDRSTLWHGLMLDIDQRRRAERELQRTESNLRQAQRLESVGALAGGIAHQFNNELQSVLGNLGLALGVIEARDPLREALEDARDAGLRAADLCRELLNYTGHAPPILEAVDLNTLLREMARLFQVGMPRDAVLALDLAPEAVVVEADRTQLRQLFLNLVTNAAEALAESGTERTLTLRTHALAPEGARELCLPRSLPEGAFAAFEVEDTAGGMDEGSLARAFEPFFSTKGPGRGMGLAAALGIVGAHGGGIRIERRGPPAGTRVRVLLPAHGQGAVEAPAPERGARHFGRALLVDDDAAVRRVCEKILAAEGLSVLAAESGARALALLEEGRGPIDVAILDLTMPGLDGHATLERLRRNLPELPVVLISGYDSSHLGSAPLDPRTRFLPKPFLPEELIAAVLALQEPPSSTV